MNNRFENFLHELEYIRDLIPPDAFTSLVEKAKILGQSEDKLLTVTEVAKRLGVSRTTMWRWAKNGLLPVYQLPRGHIRIRESELEKFLDNYRLFCSNNGQENAAGEI
ncbi:hypothetical protein N752_29640 [Desulforamulus aquiferis]|nr:hypothetical protein N752_29640 [Desulforamulus aquiferis]